MTESNETIEESLAAVMIEESGISDEAAEETGTEETVEAQADTETDVEVEEDDDESGEPETVFDAPEHWSSDERESFSSLPPEAQQILLQRDKQFQRGYQEKAQAISAINEAIEPFRESLIRRGMTPQQAIGLLFNAQDQLEKNPLEGILRIARDYGVVDQLQQQFAPTDDDDFTDPGIKALQEEIRSLKGQIGQTNQSIQQQAVNAGQQRLDAFKNAKSEDGSLKHPHFDDVIGVVTAYVQNGETLDSAYEKAVWTVPEFRNSQLKKADEKTDEEKAKKVKQAKRAARGVKTNGKTDPLDSDEPLSLEDDLKAAWRQLSQ